MPRPNPSSRPSNKQPPRVAVRPATLDALPAAERADLDARVARCHLLLLALADRADDEHGEVQRG